MTGGMKSLGAAVFLWIVLGVLFLPLFLPLLNADGTSYISIAEKYARGDFRNAINGYWGPLLSWLMAPLIAFGVGPFAAARIVILAAGQPLLLPAGPRAKTGLPFDSRAGAVI
jgi:hypothetical protein